MNLNWLRIASLTGCAAFVLLSAPRMQAVTPSSLAPSFAQDRDDWDRPDNAWSDVQRQGFHDGIEAARQDVANRRRPDADDRNEYRHPPVRGRFKNAYRESFMRGYNVAISHMANNGPAYGPPPTAYGPPPVVGGRGSWDAFPDGYDEVRRNGFRHGIDSARDDFENHRNPDVNRHDTYRHPDVPRDEKRPFQEGFRRGYRVAWEHLSNGYNRRY